MGKYAQFEGRARPKEFWMFYLVSTIVSLGLLAIDVLIGTYNEDLGVGAINGLFLVVILTPFLAVGCRRLHDTGKSGWLQLVALVPIAGAIILIVFWALGGHPGENQYGRNPAEPSDASG